MSLPHPCWKLSFQSHRSTTIDEKWAKGAESQRIDESRSAEHTAIKSIKEIDGEPRIVEKRWEDHKCKTKE